MAGSLFRLKRLRRGVPTPPPAGSGALAILHPGSNGPGFWGATGTPAARGNPSDPGHNRLAIGDWDTVPYQDVNGDFYVCVFGWHRPTAAEYAAGYKGEIEYASMSINDGAWVTVSSTSMNPLTGVIGFRAKIEIADFSTPQLIEIRAILYPRTGIPLVLQGAISNTAVKTSLFLFMNPGNAAASVSRYVDPSGGLDTNTGIDADHPVQTIQKATDLIKAAQGGDLGGGVIKLLAGNHNYSVNDSSGTKDGRLCASRWLTIQPAEGVAKSAVTFTAASDSNGIRTQKVRVKGVMSTVRFSTTGSGIMSSSGMLWLDDITHNGGNSALSNSSLNGSSWAGGVWVTNTVTQQTMFPIRSARMARNVEVFSYGSDAFQQVRTIINCHAHDNVLASGAHPDIWQSFVSGGTVENTVVYGLLVDGSVLNSQLILIKDSALFKNCAWVDYTGAQDASSTYIIANVNNHAEHLLFLRTNLTGGGWNFDTDPVRNFQYADVVFVDCANTTQFTWATDSGGSSHATPPVSLGGNDVFHA